MEIHYYDTEFFCVFPQRGYPKKVFQQPHKAESHSRAQEHAYQYLAGGLLPQFAKEQLQGLLQSIWSEEVRQRAGVRFASGQVIVSVKGGEVIEGGAPLDLIVDKVITGSGK